MTDDFDPKPFAMPRAPIPVGPAKGKPPGVQPPPVAMRNVDPEAQPDRRFVDDPYDIVLSKLYEEQQLLGDAIIAIERLKGRKGQA